MSCCQPDLVPHVAPEGLDLAPGQDVLQPDGGDGPVVDLDGAAGQRQGVHLDAGQPEVRDRADALGVRLWEGDILGDEILEGPVGLHTEVVEGELAVGRDGVGKEPPLVEVVLIDDGSIDDVLVDTAITMVDGDDMPS